MFVCVYGNINKECGKQQHQKHKIERKLTHIHVWLSKQPLVHIHVHVHGNLLKTSYDSIFIANKMISVWCAVLNAIYASFTCRKLSKSIYGKKLQLKMQAYCAIVLC